MKYSENYEFSLPYKADNDPADIDLLSENFRLIDEILKKHEGFLGNNAKVLEENEVTLETLPSEIPAGVSYCFVNQSNFVDNVWQVGLLVNYNSNRETDAYRVFQVWYGQLEASAMQRKSQSSSGSLVWGEFKKYVTKSDLTKEVEDALTEAKESGDFKGDSYVLTEADKAEITAELSQIEAPKIVSSVEEMTDTTKHYVLKDTNTIWSFQTVKTTTQPSQKPNFTNLANPNSSQWKNGYRISGSASSSGYVTGLDGYVATNIIGEVAVGDVIRIQGMDLTSNNAKVCMCLGADDVTPAAEGVSTLAQLTSAATVISNTSEGAVFATQKSGYWRFSGVLNGASEDIIITINEEITYTEVPGETISKQEWVDTGISYTPTFKTDLIGVLGEGNVIYLSDNNLPSGTYTLKYSKDDYEAIGTYIVE